MTPAHFNFSPPQQAVVDYFKRNFAKNPASFVSDIDRRCQMYAHGVAQPERDPGATFTYFDSALKMLHPLRALTRWRFGALSKVGRLLDFASGYGRLTRFLVQELQPSALVISEIQPEAVEFQRRTFGVEGLVSVTDPAKLNAPSSFDCIFVASLFTHLPEHRFHAWLARLIELLTPNGMLVFSVHDESLLLPHRPMPASGFDFNPSVSEVDSLVRSEYGSTHVSSQFVGQAIEKASRGRGSHHRIPRGLWHHDLYVYTRDGAAGSAKPGIGVLIPQNIIGVTGGHLPLWFLETERAHRIQRAELLKAGRVIATSGGPGTLAFPGDGRFLPVGWAEPLNVVFTAVPSDSFGNDIVVRIHSSGGDTRLMPVWSPA